MGKGNGKGEGSGGKEAAGRQTLKPGENMAQLTEVRRTLEKELGSDACKRIRTPIFALDVVLVIVYPLIAWAAAYFVWTSRGLTTLQYWLAAPISGWAMLSCSLVYHDVCGHRAAFGKWGSWAVGLWVTSGSPMLTKEMNTTWMARHRIHHKHTFEAKDPELFRNSLAEGYQRVLCLFGLYRSRWRNSKYQAYNAAMDVRLEYPGSLGDEYALKMRVERHLVKGLWVAWLSLIANGGALNEALNGALSAALLSVGAASSSAVVPSTTYAAMRTVLSAVSWFGVFDTIRFILEHGEQDMDNPFWQSTLYVTGFWTRLACTWDSGDCHTVHHIWHDVPIYRMPEAVQLINPIMVKHGVTLRTSFWALVWAYLIKGEPHANKWGSLAAEEAAKNKAA